IHDTDLPAVKAETALIVEDTGTTLPATLATIAGYTDGIAGDVWSHATRTLTIPAVAMSDPEDGTTLTLYKDADINIEFTGLTIPTGAKKVVFTIKDNLDDADTAAALQATYQLTAVPAETHTLNYINSATPPTLTNPVTFTVTTDSVEFDMTAAAAYYLPRYERGYLKWDLKLITATTVQILQQGLVQILGTSTRTVA
ncbi:MAG: Ig-like domain-containing protein, partial [Plesiomonas shigelloides]